MTPHLRKLYHRRGRHLECIAEIDKKIQELTPHRGDLVLCEYNGSLKIGVCCGNNSIYGSGCHIYLGDFTFTKLDETTYITILEKGFER